MLLFATHPKGEESEGVLLGGLSGEDQASHLPRFGREEPRGRPKVPALPEVLSL